jgi:hypothetical protein
MSNNLFKLNIILYYVCENSFSFLKEQTQNCKVMFLVKLLRNSSWIYLFELFEELS